MPTLTPALRGDYQQLFDTCQIRPERQAEVNRIAERIVAGRPRYASVEKALGVPWHVVGVIHSMEAGLRLDTHLHNGDPLTRRTVQVPVGRPLAGQPPFTWEESAIDALRLTKFDRWDDWSVPGTLFMWERYNGWGYRSRHPEVKSPYLWSFTTVYSRGKYIADGTWSATAVSGQAGAAALLRRLAELRALAQAPQQVLRFAPKTVTPRGAELQRFLNGFPGIFLREDGKLGPRTSDAYQQVFGQRLLGDPRGPAG